MPTVRLMAPVLFAGQPNPAVTGGPVNVNGRVYPPVAPGTMIDVPDFDAAGLCGNGYTRIALSGPTSARPSTNPNATPPYFAAAGVHYVDTSLSQIAAAIATNGATTTSSPTLNFAAAPASVLAGMTAFDATNGNALGTVLSATGTTVTLTANATHAVSSGDVVTFSINGRLITHDGVTWRDPVTGSAV